MSASVFVQLYVSVTHLSKGLKLYALLFCF